MDTTRRDRDDAEPVPPTPIEDREPTGDERYDRALACALDIWERLEIDERRDKPHAIAVMTFAILEVVEPRAPDPTEPGRSRADSRFAL